MEFRSIKIPVLLILALATTACAPYIRDETPSSMSTQANNGGSAAAGETTLHSFVGGSSDGTVPMGLVVSGGKIYGTMQSGGSAGNGIVFSMNTDGSSFTILHSFTGAPDGSIPESNVVLLGSTLYGTTFSGGANNDGMIFSIGTNGSSYTDLHDFAGGGSDGEDPSDNLVISGSTLYGTTFQGGTGGCVQGCGTIFTIDTNGTGFNLIYSFTGSSGHPAPDALILSGSTLYGTTWAGGADSDGMLYSIATNGSGFFDIHDFAGGPSDGKFPGELNGFTDGPGSLILSGSTLYGTTYAGGTGAIGTIYSSSTDGSTYAILQDFEGSLLLSGSTFYGVAPTGGTSNDGRIFSMATDGSDLTALYSFSGGSSDGKDPQSLVLSGSTLYGITNNGGTDNNGVVFSYGL